MSRLTRSIVYAIDGIHACFRKEPNMRIHLFSAASVGLMGIVLQISPVEWAIMVICIGFVTGLELVNTAIEQLCDMVTKEVHPSIKLIKDISAGAVLISACMAGACGAIIFIPKLFSLINH